MSLITTVSSSLIQRREELVGGVGLRARELIEERRLSGVRVAHERNRQTVAPLARTALRAALALELLELFAKLLHANADHAAVEFDLLFARAPGLAEAASLTLQVRPPAHEAG